MENSMTVGETSQETRYIALAQIDIPENARPHTQEDLQSLAQDMAKEGQLQEIVVTAKGDRYEVVAGVGRTLAGQLLSWEKIRCLVKDNLADYDRLHITFAENEEREDVSPIYQAQLMDAMMKAKNCDQRALASDIGKSENWVSEYLSLLGFSAEVQKNFARAKFSVKQLLELRKLDGDEAQLKAAKEIEEGGLSVKQTKEAVHKHLAAQGKAPKAKKPAADLAWKGEEIAVNRHFRPAGESVLDYLGWLGQALPAFMEEKPRKVDSAVPSDVDVAAKMVEPVQEAAAINA
jgi:ParB/RepB/Spo0J family partition protein